MAGIVPDPPAMSFSLTEVAFRHGEKWRIQLLDYLRETANSPYPNQMLWILDPTTGSDLSSLDRCWELAFPARRFFRGPQSRSVRWSILGLPFLVRTWVARGIFCRKLWENVRGNSVLHMKKMIPAKSTVLEELRRQISEHDRLYYKLSQPTISIRI